MPDINSPKLVRVLFAGLVHETHTFLEAVTPWEAFQVRERDSILNMLGDSSPTDGFLEVANAAGWEVIPTLIAIAEPGATLADSVLEEYWKRFLDLARQPLLDGVDAIFLVLHGAGAAVSHADLEGEILARLRMVSGAESVPIFGVYDLHANFSAAMAEHADCLVGYRENPHTDAKESSTRAARLLSKCLATGVRPRQRLLQVPVIWPPTGTATATDPMRCLLDRARKLEDNNEQIYAISVNAGFAFADGPDVCVSFVIASTGPDESNRAALDELGQLCLHHAKLGNVLDEPIDEVFQSLCDLRAADQLDGLTVLVEPSDNIGGGGPGDSMTLMRRLRAEKFENVGFVVWDPAAVDRLQNHRIGECVHLCLGGKGSPMQDGPLEVRCELSQLKDGYFELEDKQSHMAAECGDRFNMGGCAVVRCGSITVLITSIATPTMDLGQWRHFGINPEDFSILVVKAAVAHRRAFDGIAARQIWVDTPGPCSSNLKHFNYHRIRRPMYPLDEILLNQQRVRPGTIA